MNTNVSTPQRLYLMQVAALHMPEATWPIPIPCYLVHMSDGKHILIDTGFPKDLPSRPGLQARKNVVEQLALLDLQPEDIDILICTHFDLDHAGHHSTFTNAELIVQRQHYELARSGYPRFAPARPFWGHPDLHYRLVDGDAELLPGIELIETHGHVRGHQSILVRLPQAGPVLLTIDAVMAQSDFTPDRQPRPQDDDKNGELLQAGARKLIDVAEGEQVALVIFGHDGQQWETLKKLPEYYQ
ncbi:MAG: N-acyl homoserine lactonase family protein [Ktedonobacteraceae bacterium]|nr:N-acyl homoserine lactonase family protein [Ktedonobacteraceae bacterium]